MFMKIIIDLEDHAHLWSQGNSISNQLYKSSQHRKIDMLRTELGLLLSFLLGLLNNRT